MQTDTVSRDPVVADAVIAAGCLADQRKLDYCQQAAGFGGIGQHFRLYIRRRAAVCLNGTADIDIRYR